MSVVIPAHDEAAVIARCLAFVTDLEPGEAEVVVVANGCSDDTARVAARTPGVRVVDLPAAGKWAALNAGDTAVAAFPRIYLDADITVSAATLRRLRDALAAAEPLVAAPRPDFVVTDRPALVRMFYAAFARLPYVRDNLVGLGVYAVNAAGRSRFGAFPPVMADDLFMQRHFTPAESRLVDASFGIETPRTLRSLVAVRTRTAAGNAELAASEDQRFARTTGSTSRAAAGIATHEPWLLPSLAVYVGITVASRLGARRAGAGGWQRDHSTRAPAPAHQADRGPALGSEG